MLKTASIIAGAFWSLTSVAGFAQEAEPPIAPAFDMMRCVNMGNSLDAPSDAEWGAPIEDADFRRISDAGFDTVRIPVRWSDYTGPAPAYTIQPEFLEMVRGHVNAALEQDLNVILNVHHFEEIMSDPQGQLRKLLAIWRQLGDAFSDAPDDLWFETLNEPNDKLKGRIMQAAQTTAILAIREQNPDRIIILGGEDWSGIDSLGTNIAPTDNNIVYTFHYYDPFDFTHQGATWTGPDGPKKKRGWGTSSDKRQLAEDIKIATSFREAVGHPVFVGEFGVYDPVEASERVEWVGAVRQSMETAGVPWCLWAFSNTFALYDRTDGWDDDMAQALGVRPVADPVLSPPNTEHFASRVQSRSDATTQTESWGKFTTYFEGKSWGTENVLSGVAEINPGEEIHPPHAHAEEEYLMIIEGEGTWSLNGETLPAKAGDMLYAVPWEVHGVKNTGEGVLKFVFWKWNSSGITPPDAPDEEQ